ncbi:hypothetical protein T484DRAFT_1844749, partial [Baffinella frigidus]
PVTADIPCLPASLRKKASWEGASFVELGTGLGLCPPATADIPCLPASLRKKASWEGASFVELGAGLGLCSIVAQRMGMAVVATDGDASVLEQLVANARRNPCAGKGTKLRTKLLKWGVSKPMQVCGLDAPADVIVATG